MAGLHDPLRRFADTLAGAAARLGADVDRYSFIVVDSHHLVVASLPAHSHAFWCSPGLARLVKATAGTYIGNNVAAIADYAARWDHGEIISFAESTFDLIVSRRFAKKQQMQWSKKGAHRLLQPAPSTAHCATCSPPGIRPCPPTMSNLPHSLPQPELPHGFWCSRWCSLRNLNPPLADRELQRMTSRRFNLQ